MPPKYDGETSLSSGIYYFDVPYHELFSTIHYVDYLDDNNVNAKNL